eukprot:GHVU01115612.1.p2 GENE.GHVU01115612.1~~GHVU01115612.1.p2  ORF type:complete len:122 (+),score=1.44 GHVU01115612.1:115-480(+)
MDPSYTRGSCGTANLTGWAAGGESAYVCVCGYPSPPSPFYTHLVFCVRRLPFARRPCHPVPHPHSPPPLLLCRCCAAHTAIFRHRNGAIYYVGQLQDDEAHGLGVERSVLRTLHHRVPRLS